jgi:hypothetical protein
MAEVNPEGDHRHVQGQILFATIVVKKATKKLYAYFIKESLKQSKVRKLSKKVRQIQH